MVRQHRGYVIVQRSGNASIYQNLPLPFPGWEVLGTVETYEGTGALIRNQKTGIYCQLNAGVLRSLPQHKVAAAIAAGKNDNE